MESKAPSSGESSHRTSFLSHAVRGSLVTFGLRDGAESVDEANAEEPREQALGGCSCLAYDAGVKRINCVCGVVLEGKDDDELWKKAQAHLRADHPELVGKVSREDILAQAEEV